MRLPSFALGVVLLCSFTCIASATVSDPAPLQQGDAPAKPAKPKKKPPSDAQIKQLLIDESIAAYSGNSPAPTTPPATAPAAAAAAPTPAKAAKPPSATRRTSRQRW